MSGTKLCEPLEPKPYKTVFVGHNELTHFAHFDVFEPRFRESGNGKSWNFFGR